MTLWPCYQAFLTANEASIIGHGFSVGAAMQARSLAAAAPPLPSPNETFTCIWQSHSEWALLANRLQSQVA